MDLKETLLRGRSELLEKRDTIDRDIRHYESLLLSQCGWFPSMALRKVDTSVPAIAYGKEARVFIQELGEFWGTGEDITSAAFIAWLNSKYGEAAVRENSARSAIIALEKEGLLKVKVEGRGRIGTTYSLVTKPLSADPTTNPHERTT